MKWRYAVFLVIPVAVAILVMTATVTGQGLTRGSPTVSIVITGEQELMKSSLSPPPTTGVIAAITDETCSEGIRTYAMASNLDYGETTFGIGSSLDGEQMVSRAPEGQLASTAVFGVHENMIC